MPMYAQPKVSVYIRTHVVILPFLNSTAFPFTFTYLTLTTAVPGEHPDTPFISPVLLLQCWFFHYSELQIFFIPLSPVFSRAPSSDLCVLLFRGWTIASGLKVESSWVNFNH
jgi:hypothetical protein